MPLPLWQIVVLAIVQGLTEFLPISSSGHLVVLATWLSGGNVEQLEVADVSVVLHLGTLASILVVYGARLVRLLGEDRRAIPLLIVGTLPAVVIGLGIELTCKELIESALLAGLMLPVTGLVLLWAARQPVGAGQYTHMSWRSALVIGLGQAAAILPGLSRSGTTISVGLQQGLAPRAAATFSFLLAVPAIAGAGVLKLGPLASDQTAHTPWLHLLLGGFVSFLVGLVALYWLIRWLERGRLQLFAWWCIPLGIAVTLHQLWLLTA
jgi:undecaprenyl-diphosphatase